jgi:hypothetical protein
VGYGEAAGPRMWYIGVCGIIAHRVAAGIESGFLLSDRNWRRAHQPAKNQETP